MSDLVPPTTGIAVKDIGGAAIKVNCILRKPVFGVSDRVRLKSVYLAAEMI